MRLEMTVDVDLEKAGLDPEEIKGEMWNFVKELLLLGAVDMEIGLTLQKVKHESIIWTSQ